MDICLIYLGNRGGGARLTRDIYVDLQNSGHDTSVLFKVDSEFSETYLEKNLKNIGVNWSASRFLTLFLSILNTHRIAKIIKDKYPNPTLFVFTMPHPYNENLIRRISRKSNAITLSVIHDDKSHLGEFWPTKRFIKKLISKSDYSMFLSEYVLSKFPKNENFLLTTLESLPLLTWPFPLRNPETLLAPGRIKKYKNLEGLLDFSTKLTTNYKIKIVGQGKLGFPKGNANIIFENRWLSSIEFEREIASAGCVLSFYSEATQSGPVAIAKAYGIPVISNFKGGVAEQLENYPSAYRLHAIEDISIKLLDEVSKNKYDYQENRIFPVMDISKQLLRLSSRL